MLLDEIARTSAAVAETSARSAKVAALASCLRDCAPGRGADRRRVPVRHPPAWADRRRLGGAPRPPAAGRARRRSSFSRSTRRSGRSARRAAPGSQAARRRAVAELFSRATEPEQRFLRALLHGELRQGALESVVADAVARAAGVPVADVRRALMLAGDLGVVATAALADGQAGLARFGLEVLRPLKPMLAQTAESPGEALARVGAAAVEWKLDGARLQVHRRGDEVRAFTRNLADITDRVPEVVEAVLALPVDAVVLDGEAIALRAGRSPRAVPGDDEPLRQQHGRVRTRAVAALPVLLRLPPPRRRGPSRPAARGAPRVARRARPGVDAPGDPRDDATPRRPSASSRTRSRTATRA